jgi:hypothetical protein
MVVSEFTWNQVEGQFVDTLRASKVEPVPAEIVKLAQKSLDGEPGPDGSLRHAYHVELPTVEQASAFEKHMRNAGAHTTPVSSVTVVRDPDRKRIPDLDQNGEQVVNPDTGRKQTVLGPAVNPRKVAFRAGEPRGRKPKNS